MSHSIKVIRSAEDVKAWRKSLPAETTIGFVPTMGALHSGHAELLRQARSLCEVSVLSIFVNPTQFGPNEDLAKYPRTFESDLAIAEKHGVDVVFAPTPEVMYPAGYSTYVEELEITKTLCGKFRPGHFRGVTTVVLKLFNLVRPNIALFGLKDAQQFFVLHKMAKDLDLDVSVQGVQTIREIDGLALSSRNVYLSLAERELAPRLYAVLRAAAVAISQGADRAEALARSIEELQLTGFKPQYLECLELPGLTAPTGALSAEKPYLLAVAAYLGATRLIDNVIIRPERLKEFGIQFS